MEIIGHIQLYGLSPSINFFEDSLIDLADDDKEVNVLLSETCDLRHVMKSLADELIKPEMKALKDGRKNPVNLYIHEKNLECLARDLLFLTIMCETGMSKRDRMELFLDIYGNILLRDKSDSYLQGVI